MILKLFPHTIQWLVQSSGYEDSIGDWHEGTSQWSVDTIKCDAVKSSGEARFTRIEDGEVINYSYCVYMPKKSRIFSIGERVRITYYDNQIIEAEVKGFCRYQLQDKIWI